MSREILIELANLKNIISTYHNQSHATSRQQFTKLLKETLGATDELKLQNNCFFELLKNLECQKNIIQQLK